MLFRLELFQFARKKIFTACLFSVLKPDPIRLAALRGITAQKLDELSRCLDFVTRVIPFGAQMLRCRFAIIFNVVSDEGRVAQILDRADQQLNFFAFAFRLR